jgi:purine-binding chemotaxis protein CheW
MNIVIRSDGGPVSLLVDEICDVLEVPGEDWRTLPEHLLAARRALLQGSYPLESDLLLVIDTERVVALGAD